MPIATLLAMTITQSPLAAPVTLSLPAAPIGKVLFELSQASKVQLEVSPIMAGSVVLVSVKNEPLSTVLNRIAVVTSGSWKQDGAVWRLGADRGAQNREYQQELAARSQELAKEVKKRTEKKDPATGAASGGIMMAFSGLGDSPEEQAITSVLLKLSPADLAAIEPNERVVFSTNPTRMQRPLPSAVNDIVQTWVAAHNAKVPDQRKQMDQQSAMMGMMPDIFKDMMTAGTREVKAPIVKSILVAKPMSAFLSGLQIELKGFDADGNIALSANTMLMSGDLQNLIAQITGKKPTTGSKGTPIEWSEDSKQLQTALTSTNRLSGGGMTFDIAPALGKKLLAPDKFEPLGFIASDQLFALAKSRKKDIIALVPDDLFSQPGALTKLAGTVEQFEEDQAAKYLRITDAEDCLLVKSAHPDTARRNRVNRIALGNFLRAASKTELPRLDDVAAFALQADSPAENNVAMTYVSFYAPTTLQSGMFGPVNWQMQRFYGLLTGAQRMTLSNGDRLAMSSMTPGQQEALAKMVYGPNAVLTVDRPSQTKGDFFTDILRNFMPGGKDYRDEPTEVLANGLPTDGTIIVKVSTDSVFKPDGENGKSAPYALGSDELAIFKLLKSNPMMGQGLDTMPQNGRIANRTTYAFTFQLANGVSLTQSLQDTSLSPNSQTVSMSNLPASLQKSIDSRYEEFSKSKFAALMAIGMSQQNKVRP